MTDPDHHGDRPADRPAEDIPPRPEEDIADAVRTADDDAAGAGASGGPAPPRPGRIPAYPASPRPVDGPLSSPTPDIADPDYHPPDYPTGQSEPAGRDRT